MLSVESAFSAAQVDLDTDITFGGYNIQPSVAVQIAHGYGPGEIVPERVSGREGAGAIVQVDHAALVAIAHRQVEVAIEVHITGRHGSDCLGTGAEGHGMGRVEVEAAGAIVEVDVAALLRRSGDDVERTICVHIRQRQAPVRGVSRRCATRPCLRREILQHCVSGWGHLDIEAVFRREDALAHI